ncbi:hypothetical protein EDD17DRAFT_171641 [Pisolithus thermaeus]|nr:hypothetical protein EDD17DRAFT_171641 [Pisolithus thermaeus]
MSQSIRSTFLSLSWLVIVQCHARNLRACLEWLVSCRDLHTEWFLFFSRLTPVALEATVLAHATYSYPCQLHPPTIYWTSMRFRASEPALRCCHNVQHPPLSASTGVNDRVYATNRIGNVRRTMGIRYISRVPSSVPG